LKSDGVGIVYHSENDVHDVDLLNNIPIDNQFLEHGSRFITLNDACESPLESQCRRGIDGVKQKLFYDSPSDVFILSFERSQFHKAFYRVDDVLLIGHDCQLFRQRGYGEVTCKVAVINRVGDGGRNKPGSIAD
jgi:hypothetical protein